MNELQIFSNEEFGQVRTVIKDGQPWLVGKDIAEALGFGNPRQALISNVSEEDKGVHILDTPGGKQELTIISESGMYSLIFNSRLESARRFKHWVTSEVLPSIRKNGGYITNQENLTPEQIVANALIVAQNIILDRERQIAEMKPKADYFDELVDRNLLTNFRDTAKELHIKEKDFISFLISKKYVYRNSGKLYPYAEKNNGLFEIKEFTNEKWTGNQTLITPKGRETFRLLIKGICG